MEINILDTADQEDKNKLYALWESVLGDTWPIEQQNFENVVFAANSTNFVAENDGNLIGLLSIHIGKEDASIVCILVDKENQRKGIGSELIELATQNLKQLGVKKISLGSGAGSYFWPGVPKNLIPATDFFKKLEWEYSEISVDMIGKLANYETPSGVFDKTDKLGITLELAKENQIQEISEFEQKNFPNWYKYFSSTLDLKNFDDILLALNDGKILGSVLINRSKKDWNKILGSKIGELGALGVLNEARGKGIGLALAAKGTEILKNSGVEVCYLGWTWLIDWYGKLGYEVWREYQMSSKNI